ncbi:ABC transporter permease/M1 family aminopeptidase [Sphingomonas sp. LY160]|uniref:ABC transporter permease/M1 family aminopeptidase n=1 Tax=Sphingomonas sp. LY160 TaxID=3095342 RepID=UPI002ADED387|nr:M1 family aminopeptidase [Sphingomonas sp. LY160]MEA1071587.1 aminopeptidase [Sphingomonas sp. LY160]
MRMLLGITRFELRYQLKNPVFWVAIAIFFLLGFGLTASENVSIGTPGAINENSPFAIATATALLSLFYLFIVTAFVANAIVRDDSSGFAPIVRATSVTKTQIVIGRFLGGLLVAWLGYLAVPAGMGIGSMMPWVDPETVGPQKLSYYAYNFAIFALPNVLLTSAILFALATVMRSMMASYIGAVVLVMGYLVTISVAGQNIEYRQTFARFEPLGNGALRETTRYWTQADLNSRLVDLSGLLLFNRLFAIGLGLVFLALTVWRFSMSERAPSKRRLRRLAKREARDVALAAVVPASGGDALVARSQRSSRWVQFRTRLAVEVRQVLTSPGLIVLGLFAIGNTAAGLWLGQSTYGTSEHPTLAATINTVRGGFSAVLLMIAVFYGGELVWRERDRKLNEIIDSTPVPSWVMTVPKIVAIFVVLLVVNLAAMVTGLTYQLIEGAPQLGIVQYFTWFIIPAAIDGLLIAVLAVVMQVLSPNKYVGWGIIFVWFVGSIFLSNMGYSNPLYTYAASPSVPLSDFVGAGSFWKGALTLQFYWMCFALILAVLAHLLWPRGTDLGLRVRAARAFRERSAVPLALAGTAAVAMAATGAYAYHNIKVLNRYETSDEIEAYTADLERKYLKYENLPRPVVTRAALNADLFPSERRLDVTGRYWLRNDTDKPIAELHLRRGDPDTQWLRLDLSGARVASNDERFGYRIYRFDQPLAPGATATLDFKSRIWHRGFRAGAPATDVIENGTFANNSQFAPIIGMSRQGLLTDRAKRRRQGLPAELRMAKLEDMSATSRNYIGVDWVQSDITLTTDADQTPIAPGRKVSDVTRGGRRTARFVSPAPILNFFSIQSAKYQTALGLQDGVELSVHYQRGHGWNVPKMLKAMGASLAYYRSNFGPYQFDYARIIEFPGYASFAQAFAGTMPYSESIGFNADTSDPEKIDFTSYVIAHEIAHQYWAHQVIGADMQGGTLTSETLAQYSALMVMKRLYGPEQIRRFLKYELDSYLSARKGEVVEELPLNRVENQGYVHYRKGSLAMYLLQERLGEASVNRALQRFVAAWRFKGAPYLRSTDLIAEFRKEAKSPADQALITDLFERITIYDMKVTDAATVREGAGWKTTITVAADKYYADGKGGERKAALSEPVEVGLFTARPGLGTFKAKDVILIRREPLRSGSQKLTLLSKVRPTFAGVDPYNFYVDKNSDDNVSAIGAN